MSINAYSMSSLAERIEILREVNTNLRMHIAMLESVAMAARELCEYRGCGEPPPSYFDVLRSSLAALDAKEVQQ